MSSATPKDHVNNSGGILLLMKKNPFTAVGQIKNTLQGVGILCQSQQSRQDFTVNTDGSPQDVKHWWASKQEDKNQKTSKTAWTVLKNILWTDETQINLSQNDGKRRVWRRHDSYSSPLIFLHLLKDLVKRFRNILSTQMGSREVFCWSWDVSCKNLNVTYPKVLLSERKRKQWRQSVSNFPDTWWHTILAGLKSPGEICNASRQYVTCFSILRYSF